MPYAGLTEFIERLSQEGELVRTSKEVDPCYEIGAICKAMQSRGRKAILFERVKGCSMPVVCELLSDKQRLALALETEEESLFDQAVDRVGRPVSPRIVSDGPCKEVIIREPEVDLRILPWITWNETDMVGYLTAGHTVVKDPEYGPNLGIYRMMYCSPTETFTHFSRHHPYDYYRRAEMRGEKSFPMAVAIGVDPCIFIASQFSPGIDVDELSLAGGLRGEPVELVECETADLHVPAHAQIVLEGEVSIPPKTGLEGPYGEWPGYSVGENENERIMKVRCITMRKNPVYHGIYLGTGLNESNNMGTLTDSVETYLRLKPTFPMITKVFCPGTPNAFMCIVQVDSRWVRPGLVNSILLGIGGRYKICVVVEDDVNIEDSDEVNWAVATRAQPASDLLIIPKVFGFILDPSATNQGLSSKLLIDATRKPGFRGVVSRPPKEVWEQVSSGWGDYGWS